VKTETSESLADDRLTGVEAIREFIDPEMSQWKTQRLLELGYYPHWKEGRVYVASKTALREHWREMTRGFHPQPPKREEPADAALPEAKSTSPKPSKAKAEAERATLDLAAMEAAARARRGAGGSEAA
jgi:hypothetical protein